MGSMLLASFPGASSITTGGSCRKRKQSAKNYYASSYITTLWHKNGKIQKEYCAMMPPRHNLKQHYKVTGGGSTSQEYERKYIVNANSGQSFEYESQARDPTNIWVPVKDGFNAFYKFTRPYATFGTVMGVICTTFLAVEKLSDFSPVFFIGLLQAVVAAFSIAIFINGLNQLCDVEIDKINKPYLPLASGELSFRNGVIIAASSLILGLGFAWIIGSWPLFWTLCITALLGVANDVNLPLLRWKKSLILGTINNSTKIGVATPLGFFLHMQTYVFKRPATFPRQLIFCIAAISLFFTVLDLFKDLPDMEGDKKFGIQSLSLRLGQKQVFWICITLFQMIYGGAIVAGATSPFLWSKTCMVLGHSILALVLWYNAKSVDLKSNDAIQSFYMLIWKLLGAEFFLAALFR